MEIFNINTSGDDERRGVAAHRCSSPLAQPMDQGGPSQHVDEMKLMILPSGKPWENHRKIVVLWNLIGIYHRKTMGKVGKP